MGEYKKPTAAAEEIGRLLDLSARQSREINNLKVRVAELEARVTELEAKVRRLQESDGPMLGPTPPPRWPCPKCGKDTMEIFGHDRSCFDFQCGGVIPSGGWSWLDGVEDE